VCHRPLCQHDKTDVPVVEQMRTRSRSGISVHERVWLDADDADDLVRRSNPGLRPTSIR
jgi:hypothetical protein